MTLNKQHEALTEEKNMLERRYKLDEESLKKRIKTHEDYNK
jgi:hypothetical protein